MCYPEGSVLHAINVCPMCIVFPHPNRCPHLREVCRNRALHPRADYLYLKNAEVETFNGCGYCKWARTEPPTKAAGINNPGWPGCCRPPSLNEYQMIPAADWRAVSEVHRIQLPAEVKNALDILSPKPTSPSASRSPPGKSVMPPLDRRSSGSNSPPNRSIAGKPFASPTSTKGRSGGSPQLSAPSISTSLSRATGKSIHNSPSSPPPSSLDQFRRPAITDTSEKSASRSAHSSPSRKQVDLVDSPVTPRRNSGGRGSIPNPASSKTMVEQRPASNLIPERRRASVSSASSQKSSVPVRSSASSAAFTLPRPSQKDAGTSNNNGTESRSSDSMSDSTVTSDGGFTDYLSDESEAELQRQAEAKAALLAQNQAEEMEFRAARQALVHVGLQPPKSWNPTNITNSNSAPRFAQTGKT